MILVRSVLEDAQRRLAVIPRDASVCDAADILADASKPLVIVCNDEDVAVGVITRTDIVKVFSRARADALTMSAEAIMTDAVVSSHLDQTVQAVWETMGKRSLRSVPVLDGQGRPLGVLHARDIARALLDEVTNEEGLLRDYVLGIGYQ
jgi:CBS domain-containing protein